MRTMNVIGRIVADAERKISKGGKEFLSFRIASNEFNDKDEEGNKRTYWISVTSFNQRHFGMTQYLTKGKPILIEGDYSDRIYQNKDGYCDIARDILANSIYFVDTSNGENKETETSEKTVIPATQTSMTPKKETKKPKVNEEISEPEVATTTDEESDDLPF